MVAKRNYRVLIRDCVSVFHHNSKRNQSRNMKFEQLLVYKIYLGQDRYWALSDQDQGHCKPSAYAIIQTVRFYN